MFEPEKKRVADKIKDYIKNKEPIPGTHIMLRDDHILSFDEYLNLYAHNRINPQDAYVYISIDRTTIRSDFSYPFLDHYEDLLKAYLSKFGFHYWLTVVPATGLKYIAAAVRYRDYLSIEISDLLIVANNTNLPKIAFGVLDGKLISGKKELTDEEYEKILSIYEHQKLFAGHDFVEAKVILFDYYDKRGREWAIKIEHAKEVERIATDYGRIFHPYRVCYDIYSWKEVDCWSIKL